VVAFLDVGELHSGREANGLRVAFLVVAFPVAFRVAFQEVASFPAAVALSS